MIPLQQNSIVLSTLVVLLDDYATKVAGDNRVIQGNSKMSLSPGTPPVQKTGALYALANLTPGEYTATVTADYYFDTSQTSWIESKTSPANQPPLPVVYIRLEPRTAAAFAPNTALIQGAVRDATTDLPLPGAAVWLADDAEDQGRCDSQGRFVLPLPAKATGSISICAVTNSYRQCCQRAAISNNSAYTNLYLNRIELT